MIIEVAHEESFRKRELILGPEVLESTDYTGKVRLQGLKPGEPVFYRVAFVDLSDSTRISMPQIGTFRTAPKELREVRFVWSGDTVGQGFGIDTQRGGLRSFESIRQLKPDFFVNSGDVCYADNPLQSEVRLDDGSIWKNIVTEGKSKVAESLEEFRSNYRYNLLDINLRKLNAEVPTFVQWDDHETLNNWYPVRCFSKILVIRKRAFLCWQPGRGKHSTNIFRFVLPEMGCLAFIGRFHTVLCWKYSSWICERIVERILQSTIGAQ